MRVLDRINNRVRSINDLIKRTTFDSIHPVGFVNGALAHHVIDTSGQIGSSRNYQRYAYDHGLRFLVTIVRSVDKPPYVMSLLIEERGEIINPLFKNSSDPDYVEVFTFTIQFLDMMIDRIEEVLK